jgi:hypothetical protein
MKTKPLQKKTDRYFLCSTRGGKKRVREEIGKEAGEKRGAVSRKKTQKQKVERYWEPPKNLYPPSVQAAEGFI